MISPINLTDDIYGSPLPLFLSTYIYIYARHDRASYLFLILKQELFCLHHFFPCVCVSILTQRSIYEAFFSGMGRIREIWIPMDVWITWALHCGFLFFLFFFYYITCHIPSLLKNFPFSSLFFYCFCVWLLKMPAGLLSCLGLKIVYPALAQLLAACIDLAQNLYLVLSYLVNQAAVFIFFSLYLFTLLSLLVF